MKNLILSLTWRKMLYSDDYLKQSDALHYVTDKGKVAAIKHLLEIIEINKGYHSRDRIISSLSTFDFCRGEEQKIIRDYLLNKIEDVETGSDLLIPILNLLGKLNYDAWQISEILDVLKKGLIEHDNSKKQFTIDVKKGIISLLSKIKNRKSFEILLQALDSREKTIKEYAAESISYYFDENEFEIPSITHKVKILWYEDKWKEIQKLGDNALEPFLDLVKKTKDSDEIRRFYVFRDVLLKMTETNINKLKRTLQEIPVLFAYQIINAAYLQKMLLFEIFVKIFARETETKLTEKKGLLLSSIIESYTNLCKKNDNAINIEPKVLEQFIKLKNLKYDYEDVEYDMPDKELPYNAIVRERTSIIKKEIDLNPLKILLKKQLK